MLDLYFWPTPNGRKITIMLEEVSHPYRIVPVNIGRGEQFTPSFLTLSPNNRMPAIVDHEPLGGGAPLSIFESGAILQYLGDKTGKLLPTAPRARYDVLQWLVWQVAGLGPMAGQAGHFRNYAAEKIPYAIDRYTDEVHRLYGVMDTRLKDRQYLAGEYSIADIACFPWVLPTTQGQAFDEFPNLARWHHAIAARPAVIKAMDVGADLRTKEGLDDEAKKHLFGQRARK